MAVALWLHADPSAAAFLTAVRVGTHPGYTRVVLETDAPAAYQVLEASADTPGEVTVQIAAESRARDVAPGEPDSPSVALLPQPDGTTLARIHARGPLRVETQVLAAPPRLVLDLRRAVPEATATASAPEPALDIAPTPPPEAVETPAPEVVETPPPIPQQLAVAPSVVEPAPMETPEPEATPAPAPAPAPVEAPPAIDAPPPVAAAPPPVAPVVSPPRAGLGIDPRSLAVGLAAGFGLALIALAARRQRKASVVAPASDASIATPESISVERIETVEAAAAPEPEAVAGTGAGSVVPVPEVRDEWMLDVLRMHQRLDARLAEIADRLDELGQRQARLEARGGAQDEELASQRTAIARLQRSLRPASPAQTPRQVR